MSSLSDVKGSAVDLLSQLLKGGGLSATAGGETTADTSAGDFVEALGERLRERLVQAGADPAEIAGLDGQALLAQCMSLIQWPSQIVQTPTDQTSLDAIEIPEAVSGAPQAPSELLEWLRLSAGTETAGERGAEPESDAGRSLAFARQLLQSMRTEGSGINLGTPLEQTGEPFLSTALTQLAAATVDGSDSFQATAAPTHRMGAEFGWLDSALLSHDDPSTVPKLDPEQDLADMFRDADADGDTDAAAQPTTTFGLIGSLAAERQTPAVRAQILDLSKLLQPGGDAPLAEQVSWMMRAGSESAELKLHPANLGSLDVRITLEDDQAHVHFVSPHPIVREVIEAALPRLRESLAQEGVTLANVSVSDQTPGGRGESGREGSRGVWSDPASASVPAVEIDEPPTVHSTLSALAGRHDYFA